MNSWRKSFMISVVIVGLLAGCGISRAIPPPRDFNTVDLLIEPDLLPNGWVNISDPTTEVRPDAMGFRNTLRGSEIELRTLKSSIGHMIVVFPSAWDAARAYREHGYTRNTSGIYPRSWEPLAGFEYTSPRANQFRVVCLNMVNVPKLGEKCIIEAQYDEFLSIFIYDTIDENQFISELRLLAKAVDTQIMKYLDK